MKCADFGLAHFFVFFWLVDVMEELGDRWLHDSILAASTSRAPSIVSCSYYRAGAARDALSATRSDVCEESRTPPLLFSVQKKEKKKQSLLPNGILALTGLTGQTGGDEKEGTKLRLLLKKYRVRSLLFHR